MLIAIDGPSGVGKTTIARRVAQRLGLKAVSTGALYRAVALSIMEKGLDLNDRDRLVEFLKEMRLDQQNVDGDIRTFINGTDVTQRLQTEEISEYASKVATIKEVRDYLLEVQRRIAQDNAVVEGRDIGSVVLPYADIKIFLDASVVERAKRKHRQMLEMGLHVDFETILNDIKERDERDRKREIAPLVRNPDAFYIDTTHMSPDEVVMRILKIVKMLV